MNSFEYILKDPVLNIKKLTCFEPTAVHRSLVCRLKKMLVNATMGAQEKAKEFQDPKNKQAQNQENSEFTPELILQMLEMSPGQDEDFLTRFYDHFSALLLSSNICKMDNEKGLDDATYGRMSMRDIDKIMGEYIVNFLMPSIISQE